MYRFSQALYNIFISINFSWKCIITNVFKSIVNHIPNILNRSGSNRFASVAYVLHRWTSLASKPHGTAWSFPHLATVRTFYKSADLCLCLFQMTFYPRLTPARGHLHTVSFWFLCPVLAIIPLIILFCLITMPSTSTRINKHIWRNRIAQYATSLNRKPFRLLTVDRHSRLHIVITSLNPSPLTWDCLMTYQNA